MKKCFIANQILDSIGYIIHEITITVACYEWDLMSNYEANNDNV